MLAPVLFTLFINDLEKALYSMFIKTAVDTMLGRRCNHQPGVEYNTKGQKKIWDIGRKWPSSKDTQTNTSREEIVKIKIPYGRRRPKCSERLCRVSIEEIGREFTICHVNRKSLKTVLYCMTQPKAEISNCQLAVVQSFLLDVSQPVWPLRQPAKIIESWEDWLIGEELYRYSVTK